MYICRSHNGWYGNIFSRFFSQARLTMNEEWACCKIFYTLKILKIVPAICASRPLFNVFIQKMLKFERRIHKQLLLVQQWVWLLDLQNFDSFLFRLFEIISISYVRKGKLNRAHSNVRIDLEEEWSIERISDWISLQYMYS